jgi:hypothetical protein
MAKQRRIGSTYYPTKIPIHSLSGGVARQVPTKRNPTEAQILRNVVCSTESSLDKRNGFYCIPYKDNAPYGFTPLIFDTASDPEDCYYHWMDFSEKEKYLAVFDLQNLDPDGPTSGDSLLRVFKITIDPNDDNYTDVYDESGNVNLQHSALKWEEEEVDIDTSDFEGGAYNALRYLDYSGTTGGNLKDRIRAVSVGSATLLLNTDVFAGFTSTWETITIHPGQGQELEHLDIWLRDFDGKLRYRWGSMGGGSDWYGDPIDFDDLDSVYFPDRTGSEVVYETAATVDTQGKGEVWSEFADYGWEDVAIDEEDKLVDIWNNGVWSVVRTDVNDFGTATFVFSSIPEGGQYDGDDVPGLEAAGEWIEITDNDPVAPVTNRYRFINQPLSDAATKVPSGVLFNAPSGTIDGSHYALVRTIVVNIRGLNSSAEVAAELARVINLDVSVAIGTAGTEAGDPDGGDDALGLHNVTVDPAAGGTDISIGITAFANVRDTDDDGNVDGDDDAMSSPGRVTLNQDLDGEAGNTGIAVSTGTNGPFINYDANDDGVHNSGDALIWNADAIVFNSLCSEDVPEKFLGGELAGIDDPDDLYTPYWGGYVEGDPDAQQPYPDNLHGSEVRYGMWRVKRDLPVEELPGPTNVALAKSNDKENGSIARPSDDLYRWERVPIEADSYDPEALDYEVHEGDTGSQVWWTAHISVDGYSYPDPEHKELGQSVAKLTDLTLPPLYSDTTDRNGRDTGPFNRTSGSIFGDPTDVISRLHSVDGDDIGRGKVIHLSQNYLNSLPGYYRIINTFEKPYLQSLRTPDRRSIIDKARMPVMLFKNEEGKWTMDLVGWDLRYTGDLTTNPGPSLFTDSVTGEVVQRRITAMAYYRDRLFFGSDDILVSSRAGDWDNFWISDPVNIHDTDPIDLRLSSNEYTPITYLTPFRNFLFVSTLANKQYELMGDGDLITPLNAELAPTAYYPQTSSIPPMTMNNNIFFLGDKKLYVYFGQRDVATQQAFELSQHVGEYLATDYSAVAVSSSESMLFLSPMTSTNTRTNRIICYRNRLAGEKLIQNAFFDWDISGVEKIVSLSGYNNRLFAVVGFGPSNTVGVLSHQITPDYMKPCLDGMCRLSGPATYIQSTDQTRVVLNTSPGFAFTHLAKEWDTLVRYYDEATLDNKGLKYTNLRDVVSVLSTYQEGPHTMALLKGNLIDNFSDENNPSSGNIRGFWGKSYKMLVELSPIYLRDQQNNIISGTLNLRYGTLRYYNTGEFSVKVGHLNKTFYGGFGESPAYYETEDVLTKKYDFIPDIWDDTEYIQTNPEESDQAVFFNLGIDPTGIFKFPILGHSEQIRIRFESTSPKPVNIAQMEFSGKFKRLPIHVST